jgi:hypothetical protein
MNKNLRIITAVLLLCLAVSLYHRMNHTIYASKAIILLIISTVVLQAIFLVTVIRLIVSRRQR